MERLQASGGGALRPRPPSWIEGYRSSWATNLASLKAFVEAEVKKGK